MARKIPEPYRSAIRSCCQGDSPWPLILLGNVGSGKTCAALSVTDWTYGPRMFFTEEGLQDALSSAMAGTLFEERPMRQTDRKLSTDDLWAKWRDCAIAVLDDFGQRRATRASDDLLYNAINYREHLPLIITSNLKWAEIEQRFDERIIRRLACGTIAEGFTLPDLS